MKFGCLAFSLVFFVFLMPLLISLRGGPDSVAHVEAVAPR